jgi:hypothetical protein
VPDATRPAPSLDRPPDRRVGQIERSGGLAIARALAERIVAEPAPVDAAVVVDRQGCPPPGQYGPGVVRKCRPAPDRRLEPRRRILLKLMQPRGARGGMVPDDRLATLLLAQHRVGLGEHAIDAGVRKPAHLADLVAAETL